MPKFFYKKKIKKYHNNLKLFFLYPYVKNKLCCKSMVFSKVFQGFSFLDIFFVHFLLAFFQIRMKKRGFSLLYNE